MIKMESTCSSLKCDVIYKGSVIGHMEGVNLIQWFLKNKYCYRGSFSNFLTIDPEDCCAGIVVDIVFNDKNLIAKDARIEWINSYGKNGTFNAAKMEYHDNTF
ncbi:MAG TPA: hypothetical protein VK426_05170 [Methanobacterium sp.]|nr:hypothetical protein [Methanobacterium sp.]